MGYWVTNNGLGPSPIDGGVLGLWCNRVKAIGSDKISIGYRIIKWVNAK